MSKFVSVPLRGNGYESIGLSHGKSHLNLSMVSVPLRGNGYETKVLSRYKAIAETFPSPCGEMGMKPYTHLLHEIIKGRVFPSPCGEMGMKLQLCHKDGDHQIKFPSPCGEMGMKR